LGRALAERGISLTGILRIFARRQDRRWGLDPDLVRAVYAEVFELLIPQIADRCNSHVGATQHFSLAVRDNPLPPMVKWSWSVMS